MEAASFVALVLGGIFHSLQDYDTLFEITGLVASGDGFTYIMDTILQRIRWTILINFQHLILADLLLEEMMVFIESYSIQSFALIFMI